MRSIDTGASDPTTHALALRLARRCRRIVQACLREEEWGDADREFYRIIRGGIEAMRREGSPQVGSVSDIASGPQGGKTTTGSGSSGPLDAVGVTRIFGTPDMLDDRRYFAALAAAQLLLGEFDRRPAMMPHERLAVATYAFLEAIQGCPEFGPSIAMQV